MTELEIAVQPRPVPDDTRIPVKFVLVAGFLAALITAMASAFLFIGAAFFGAVDVFLGIPFGLIALLWNIKLRRNIRVGQTARLGMGSTYQTIPQVASLALNMTLVVTLAWAAIDLVIGNIDETWDQSAGQAIGLIYVPIAAFVVVISAFYTLLSRAVAAEEVYALDNRLPARKLILLNHTLGWVTWSMVVAIMAYAIFENYH